MIELLKQTAASLAAIIAIGTAAWAFGTSTGYRPWFLFEQNDFASQKFQKVMDSTEQNTRAITQFRFDELWGLRKFGELTWDQKMSLCSYALTLQYTIVDDNNQRICSDEGTPVLTFQSQAK